MGTSSRDKNPGYNVACNRARGLLVLTRQQPPVDVDAIIERAGVPVVQRVLDEDVRATIGDVAGRRSIILNRNYQILSGGERRWILAEELGHILLGHVPRASVGSRAEKRRVF